MKFDLRRLNEESKRNQERFKERSEKRVRNKILDYLNYLQGLKSRVIRIEKNENTSSYSQFKYSIVGFGEYEIEGTRLYGFSQEIHRQHVYMQPSPLYTFEKHHALYEIDQEKNVSLLKDLDKQTFIGSVPMIAMGYPWKFEGGMDHKRYYGKGFNFTENLQPILTLAIQHSSNCPVTAGGYSLDEKLVDGIIDKIGFLNEETK